MKHIRKQIRSWLGLCGLGMLVAATCIDAQGGQADESLHLDEYQLVSGPTIIEGVSENASGVIYDKGRDALWIVMNKPTTMIELDRATLKPRRTVVLAGFDDTEDLVQLTSNKFAVIEERKQNIVIFALTNNATSVARLKSKSYNVDPVPSDNVGLEGLTFDAAHRQFYTVKEKEPEALYRVALTTNKDPEISQPWDLETHNFGMTDFSAIYFHPDSGHLVLLSDESKAVVEVTTNGDVVSQLSLKEGNAGIVERPPQPEGVTMDDHGRLYVCSEPNMLYVFERPAVVRP